MSISSSFASRRRHWLTFICVQRRSVPTIIRRSPIADAVRSSEPRAGTPEGRAEEAEDPSERSQNAAERSGRKSEWIKIFIAYVIIKSLEMIFVVCTINTILFKYNCLLCWGIQSGTVDETTWAIELINYHVFRTFYWRSRSRTSTTSSRTTRGTVALYPDLELWTESTMVPARLDWIRRFVVNYDVDAACASDNE